MLSAVIQPITVPFVFEKWLQGCMFQSVRDVGAEQTCRRSAIVKRQTGEGMGGPFSEEGGLSILDRRSFAAFAACQTMF